MKMMINRQYDAIVPISVNARGPFELDIVAKMKYVKSKAWTK